MNLVMVRSTIKEENVADAQAAIKKVIQALEQAQPADVRYASRASSSRPRRRSSSPRVEWKYR